MISVYKIKPRFQQLLQPLLYKLFKFGLTPNQLTIAAVLLSILMGISFLQYQKYPIVLLLIPFAYLIRMALNALDGMLANQFNLKSKLGEVLNELGDVISDVAIALPFFIVPSMNSFILILFIVLSIINEYAGILGKAINGVRRYEGPMGKSDRALVISLYCLISFFWNDALLYANWVFGIASILIVLSTFNRIKLAIK